MERNIIMRTETLPATTLQLIRNISYQVLNTGNDCNYPNNEQIYNNNLNPLDSQEFEVLYFMMEDTLIDLYSFKSLPNSIIHLSPQFDELRTLITDEKRKMCFNPNIVGLVCTLFLSIFDTLPIYCDSFTYEDWRRALTAKKLASLIS